MTGFADRQAARSGRGDRRGARVDSARPHDARAAGGEALEDANLYAVLELIAGRAARASTARQYRSIYTRFANALRDELGRPPVVKDVTVDAIAAYSRDRAGCAHMDWRSRERSRRRLLRALWLYRFGPRPTAASIRQCWLSLLEEPA